MKLFQRLLQLVSSKESASQGSLDQSLTFSQNLSKRIIVEKPQSPKALVSSSQTSTYERKQMGLQENELPAGSMLLLAQRELSKQDTTLSKVYCDGQFVCDMLEDTIRELPGMPVSQWKVAGKTAIPAGIYELTLETSNRFGPNTLTVNRVDGFTGVRCHGGNTAADTEGCLLFGDRSGEALVIDSQKKLKVIKSLTWTAFSNARRVFIDIRNPEDYLAI